MVQSRVLTLSASPDVHIGMAQRLPLCLSRVSFSAAPRLYFRQRPHHHQAGVEGTQLRTLHEAGLPISTGQASPTQLPIFSCKTLH